MNQTRPLRRQRAALLVLLALAGCPDPTPETSPDLAERVVMVRLKVQDLPASAEEWEAQLYINDVADAMTNRSALGKSRDEVSFQVRSPVPGTWRFKVRVVSVENCRRYSIRPPEVNKQVDEVADQEISVPLGGAVAVDEGGSQVRLNLEVEGDGAGTVQVSKLNPPEPATQCVNGCAMTLKCMQQVEIKVVPELKYRFKGFSMPCGGANPCLQVFASTTTVRMSFDKKMCRGAFCLDQGGLPYDLNGVFGFAQNDVHAVGTDGKILYRDDLGWKESTQAPGNLSAIWGAAGTLWAVGDNRLIMERQFGAGWLPAVRPMPPAERMQAVWASKWNNFYAAGTGGIVVRPTPNGVAQVVKDAGVSWNGLWGSDAEGPWLAGGQTGSGVLMRFGGGGYVQETTPSMPPLNAVWGRRVGADLDLWVAGEKGALWYRHNNDPWEPKMVADVSETLRALWGDSGSVWAVGDGGVVLRWNYQTNNWNKEPNAQMLSQQDLRGVWGDGMGTVFMVGAAGTILSYR